jgi:hypothetical protein
MQNDLLFAKKKINKKRESNNHEELLRFELCAMAHLKCKDIRTFAAHSSSQL